MSSYISLASMIPFSNVNDSKTLARKFSDLEMSTPWWEVHNRITRWTTKYCVIIWEGLDMMVFYLKSAWWFHQGISEMWILFMENFWRPSTSGLTEVLIW